MAVKNVTPPFALLSSLPIAGTSVVTTTSATSILYKDNVALQYSFTGNATGQIDIQVSNDFNPGQPESAGGFSSGVWTSLTQTSPNTLPYTLSSGTASVAVNLNQLGFAWLRTQWTNSSGTGTLSKVIAAKSLG